MEAVIDLTKENPVPVKTVAQMFAVHRRTVDSWFDAGLEWVKMRGRVYTTREALQRFGTFGAAPQRPSTSPSLQQEAAAAAAVLKARWGV